MWNKDNMKNYGNNLMSFLLLLATIIFIVEGSTYEIAEGIKNFLKVSGDGTPWRRWNGENNYDYDFNTDLMNWLDIVQKNLMLEKGEELRILDIGCAKGDVIKNIFHYLSKKMKCKVLGVTGGLETEDATGSGENESTYEIFNQFPIELIGRNVKFPEDIAEQYGLDANKIDEKLKYVEKLQPHIVLMFGTILHMTYPEETLVNIFDIVEKNGVLAVNFPRDTYVGNIDPSKFSYKLLKEISTNISVLHLTHGSFNKLMLIHKNTPNQFVTMINANFGLYKIGIDWEEEWIFGDILTQRLLNEFLKNQYLGDAWKFYYFMSPENRREQISKFVQNTILKLPENEQDQCFLKLDELKNIDPETAKEFVKNYKNPIFIKAWLNNLFSKV